MTYIYGETPWETDGPRAVWEDTQEEFTPEISAQFREAMKTRTPPPCPQCGQMVEQVQSESVGIQQRMGGPWVDEGSLVTLRPCGHRMKTIARQ